MSKWINVDAFVADARMVGLDTAEKVFFALAHQPGIDIVRCRECKHWSKHRTNGNQRYCIIFGGYCDGDKYCAWGERSKR